MLTTRVISPLVSKMAMRWTAPLALRPSRKPSRRVSPRVWAPTSARYMSSASSPRTETRRLFATRRSTPSITLIQLRTFRRGWSRACETRSSSGSSSTAHRSASPISKKPRSVGGSTRASSDSRRSWWMSSARRGSGWMMTGALRMRCRASISSASATVQLWLSVTTRCGLWPAPPTKRAPPGPALGAHRCLGGGKSWSALKTVCSGVESTPRTAAAVSGGTVARDMVVVLETSTPRKRGKGVVVVASSDENTRATLLVLSWRSRSDGTSPSTREGTRPRASPRAPVPAMGLFRRSSSSQMCLTDLPRSVLAQCLGRLSARDMANCDVALVGHDAASSLLEDASFEALTRFAAEHAFDPTRIARHERETWKILWAQTASIFEALEAFRDADGTSFPDAGPLTAMLLFGSPYDVHAPRNQGPRASRRPSESPWTPTSRSSAPRRERAPGALTGVLCARLRSSVVGVSQRFGRSGGADARGEGSIRTCCAPSSRREALNEPPEGVPTLPDPTVYEPDISASEYLVDALCANTCVRVAEEHANAIAVTRRGARIAPSPRCTVTSRRARREDGSTIRTERTTRHLIARRSCWRTR